MIQKISELTDKYYLRLKNNTTLREINDCVEITTPFLDSHNDFIQIYVKEENNRFLLTDDGYTFNNVKDMKKWHPSIIEDILSGFGVENDDYYGVLKIYATEDNFSLQKDNLIQSILAINLMDNIVLPTCTGILTQSDADRFDKLATKWSEKNNTPESARQALIKIGILNKDGTPSKNYYP